MKHCSGCGAPIVFARTRPRDPRLPSRSIPLDPDPVDDGNIVVVGGDGELYDGALVEIGSRANHPSYTGSRYVSHFVSCPDALTFKSKPTPKVVR